jgi:hypothetical protein
MRSTSGAPGGKKGGTFVVDPNSYFYEQNCGIRDLRVSRNRARASEALVFPVCIAGTKLQRDDLNQMI